MNKEKMTSVLLALLATAIIAILLYFWFFQPKKVVEVPNQNVQSELNTNKEVENITDLSCHENSKYFIVVNKFKNEPGSNFLVKYKINENQKIDCAYAVEEGDWEIKNLDGADYFFALENDFLILDNGTSNLRSLIVYSLKNEKKIFTDIYFGVSDIADNSIVYWTKSATKPTKNNCPGLDQYLANGGSALIQKKVVLNLNNLTKRDLNENRCSYVE